LRQAAESDRRTGSLIEILILQALARQSQSDTGGALIALEGALALAEPEGYRRTFLDEGEPLATLLQAAHDRGIAPDYVSKLLAAFAAEEGESRGMGVISSLPPLRQPLRQAQEASQDMARSSAPLLVEPLTERELELLRLVAEDYFQLYLDGDADE